LHVLSIWVFLNTKLVSIINLTLLRYSHKKSMVSIYDCIVFAVRYIYILACNAPCPLSIATWFVNKTVTPKLSFHIHINNKSNVMYDIKLDDGNAMTI